VVIGLTRLLVITLDLGELDLHVVVADMSASDPMCNDQAEIPDWEGREEKILTRQRSSSGHRQPSLRR
jgi:hypothetical protein